MPTSPTHKINHQPFYHQASPHRDSWPNLNQYSTLGSWPTIGFSVKHLSTILAHTLANATSFVTRTSLSNVLRNPTGFPLQTLSRFSLLSFLPSTSKQTRTPFSRLLSLCSTSNRAYCRSDHTNHGTETLSTGDARLRVIPPLVSLPLRTTALLWPPPMFLPLTLPPPAHRRASTVLN